MWGIRLHVNKYCVDVAEVEHEEVLLSKDSFLALQRKVDILVFW